MIMCFEAVHGGPGRTNHVWSGKEAHWSLKWWIVKSAEQYFAHYKPLDRLLEIPTLVIEYTELLNSYQIMFLFCYSSFKLAINLSTCLQPSVFY